MSKFIWHDLMTPDMEGAQKFYSKVIGWDIVDSGMPDGNYRICNAGKATPDGMNGVGGIKGFRPEDDKSIPPFWSGYIHTPDVGKAAQQAVKLGGKIFREPTTVPNVVEFAILTDPSGAMFNVMRPIPQGELTKFAPGTPGTMGWNELLSGDWKQAWDFYHAMFGWEKHQALEMGPVGTYQTFGLDGVSFGGMMNKRPEMPMAYWNYYWNVASCEEAVKKLNAAGGKVMFGPMQVPGGSWIVNAMDAQGAMFAVTSMAK
jgi:predicted enzyme related to lactoylglutathione lyase